MMPATQGEFVTHPWGGLGTVWHLHP